MGEAGWRLSTAQAGTLGEHFVATALMAASKGRLSPFAPVVDDHGVDLIVLDKETGAMLGIQVKSWIGNPKTRRNTVQFDVRKAAYRADLGIVLVAVVIDPETMALEAGWLMRMTEIEEVATEQANKFALAPSRSAESKDRYSPYRHMDVDSLAQALIGMMPQK